jgi:mycothiol synthase
VNIQGAAHVTVSLRLSAAERDQVEAIDRAAALVDGVSALDDQVRLDLRYGDETVRHLLSHTPAVSVATGYAGLRLPPQPGADAVGHVVVDPRVRRAGHGSALVARMTELSAGEGLRIWAHGDLTAAATLAERLGFGRVRELWRMQRPLDGTLPAPSYPDDVTVRTFAADADVAPWLALNAAAFANHPEQGSLTDAGFAQRRAQPDFDPAGFFLAERAGALLGFHWTKVHPAGDLADTPVGEVYVLGVHPAAQGLGLGKALTLTGLRYLRSLQIPVVTLYVEADNAPAVAVYSRLGFTRAAVDVLYAR